MHYNKYINKYFLILLCISPVFLFYIGHLLQGDITLACGLFAFFGSDPDTYFDWKDFKVLGVFNDERGRDACGITTNNYQKKYWHNGVVKFKDAVINKTFTEEFVVKDHILGHTRRVSSGGNNIEKAQPVIFTKGDGPPMSRAYSNNTYKKWLKQQPSKGIVFSGIHNGTIHNIDQLAEEYKIKQKEKNDTQILLEILYKGHYDVLSKYIGAASLVFYDYYEEKLFIWRGESPDYKNYNIVKEERPLYYYPIAKENFYLSSVEESLRFIGADEKHVIKVPANTLFIYHKGIPVDTIEFDRSKAYQSETTVYSSGGYSRYSGMNRHVYAPMLRHDYSRNRSISYNEDTDKEETKRLYLTTSASLIKDSYRLFFENLPAGKNKLRKVMFTKGRYWINNTLVHGLYPINIFGIVPYDGHIYHTVCKNKMYGFIEGVLIDDVEDYFVLQSIYNETIKELSTQKELTFDHILKAESEMLESFSLFTENFLDTIIHFTELEGVSAVDSSNKYRYYTGKSKPKFSDRRYEFNNGDLVKIEYVNSYPTGNIHSEADLLDVGYYLDTPDKFYVQHGHKETDMDKAGRLLIKEKRIPELSYFSKVLKGLIDFKLTSDNRIDYLLAKANYYKTFYPEAHFDKCTSECCAKCQNYDLLNDSCAECMAESDKKYFFHLLSK